MELGPTWGKQDYIREGLDYNEEELDDIKVELDYTEVKGGCVEVGLDYGGTESW